MSSARSLQEELRQTKPFESPASELVVALMRTASTLRRALAQRVEPYGISPAQYNVLRILRGAGPDGLPTLAVRDRLVEEAPGITRLIDKLERAGFVRRDRVGDDRRVVHCRITPTGRDLLGALDPAVQDLSRLVADAIPSGQDQRLLIDHLAGIRGSILPHREG
jgi:DNA-binding MarR family transcriptional regulator